MEYLRMLGSLKVSHEHPVKNRLVTIITVHRVNFLRAKARMDCWNEELKIVRKEMGWTVRGFMFYAKRWGGFKAKTLHWPGKGEYAAKQEAM
jgi:hypothetical protein